MELTDEVKELTLKPDEKELPASAVQNETQTITVSSYASFGDSKDILRKESVQSDPEQGCTIIYTMETRRKFVPGEYMTKKLRGDNHIDTIIYHKSVDPDKIKNLLFHCNVGNNFRERNYLNRYDWLHERCWGDMDERCFFVPEENIDNFVKAEKPNPFGFTVDISMNKLEGEWIYGCVLEDINTEECFALVIQDMYTLGRLDDNKEVPPLLEELKDLPREDFKFDMNQLK